MIKYDVVIIGAGVSGLNCANEFIGSDKKVLLIDQRKNYFHKVCAAGITLEDLDFIPKKFINFPLRPVIFYSEGKKILFPPKGGVISSIKRDKYLKYLFDKTIKSKNVETILGKRPKISKGYVDIDGQKIAYKYLVGADGALSDVRKHLSIKSEKIDFVLQYLVPKTFTDFEIYYENRYFGSGYAWIFPNDKFTSIGCGCSKKIVSTKQLDENFSKWLTSKQINVSTAKKEGAFINYDYRGYKFDNIYLIGDAAGLTSGVTGKGIHSAIISAKQVAREILGQDNKHNLIEEWLEKKQRQERFLDLLNSKTRRKIFLKSLPWILKHQPERVLKYL